MSYNIDSIEILRSSDFSIPVETYVAMRQEFEDDQPECSLLDSEWIGSCCKLTSDKLCLLPHLIWWNGEFSGNTLETFTNILARFNGSVDLMLCWEGGDSYTGLRLVDHTVTEHNIKMALE